MLITVSTLIAYWNVQYNGLIGYDDIKYLIENEPVRSGISIDSFKWALTATYDANWFPITWLSHMLDMTLFGSNPLGHHLENLFLHIANALLLMAILTRLTGHIWRSTVVALLFALHPLHVESVAWVAERKDVLSTLFFLLTIRSYVLYAALNSRSRYWIAVLLYICGLATKPMLVSLPAILLLLDFWPLRRIRFGELRTVSLLLREKIPFALLSFASCVITYIVQKNGGAVIDRVDSTLTENVLHAFFNYIIYLRKTFWPTDLAAIYPYVSDLSLTSVAGAAAMIPAVSLLAVYLHKRLPYVTLGWFWFLIATAPVAGFVRIGAHSIADRYTYIPSIGLFIAAVWLLSDFLGGLRHEKVTAGLLTVAVMVPLTFLTWRQTTYWKDSVTLFEHTLNVTRNNWIAHGNIGAELLKYNRDQQAIWHLRESARINPKSYVAHYNIGVVLYRQGDRPGAINAFRKVIELNPAYTDAYFEAGRISYENGDKKSAYDIQASLAQLDPDLAESLQKYFVLLDDK